MSARQPAAGGEICRTRRRRLCAAALAACVGPDFHRPAAPRSSAIRSSPCRPRPPSAPGRGRSRAAVPGAARRSQELVDPVRVRATRRTGEGGAARQPQCASAQAALRQAMENTAAQRGAYFPAVQASFDAQRQRNAVGVLAPTLTFRHRALQFVHAASRGDVRAGCVRREPAPSGIARGAGRGEPASARMRPI